MANEGTGFPGQIQGREPDTKASEDIYAKSGAAYVALRYFNDSGVPTAQGQIVLEASSSPTAKYAFSNFDDSEPLYVGKEDKDGAYYIMKYTAATGIALYTKGASGYAAAWTGRADEDYDTFATTF